MSENQREKSGLARLVREAFGWGDRREVLRENPEATVKRLVKAVVEFHHRAIIDFGGKEGNRGLNLLEQTIASAFQSFEGQDIYRDDYSKAAKILHGITTGHPFDDGDKRTGFLTAAYFLEQTGHALPDDFSVETVEKLCLDIASGRLQDPKSIAKELRKTWRGK